MVDDLVIAVHRAVGREHADGLRSRFAALGLRSPGHLIDLAEFLLAESCTLDTIRLRFRYDVASATTTFDELQAGGLVDADLKPSNELDDLLSDVLTVRAAVAATVWPGILTTQLSGARSAANAVRGPLARELGALPEPEQPAALLHHRLTILRYERMDAHAAAWAEHGLAADEVVALTTALAKPPALPPARLVERGWVSSDGAATLDGRAVRAAIELDTNERCRHLPDAEPAWIASLRVLQI